jgi:hypothetical protein
MSFFHGITITETLAGGVSIQSVKAAVIGLVGSAPSWDVQSGTPPAPNQPFLVNSKSAQSMLGPMIEGYSIPYALQHILDQAGAKGVGQVIAVNVFNPLIHNTQVSGQTLAMPASGTQYVSVGHMGLIGPGLPNTPLSTAAVDVVATPGGQTNHSYAHGDTVTLAGGTPSTSMIPATVLTVASTQIVSLGLNAPGGAATHSYAPGAGIVLAGGTSTVAGQVTVDTTQVVSATIAAGGTGGTNGTQTVTGTTGSGTKFQASVTVSGGAITAVGSISVAGAYTVNPTTLTDEPVTGAGLTGAALSLVMGVNTFSVVNPGEYTANSATFTQASSSGAGTGATFNAAVFGILAATVSTAGSYTAVPANPVAQASSSGAGTGATFNMTWAGPPSTVVVKAAGGSPTYVENTDYTVDYVNGLIYAESGGAIAPSLALSVSYAYCDPSQVQDSDLIGAVTGGQYTGMQAWQLAMSKFGFTPRILIAPGYAGNAGSQDRPVASALEVIANTLRGISLDDSAPNVSVATALASRSDTTTAFGITDYRVGHCFPCEKFEDLGIDPTATMINAAGVVVNPVVDATAEAPYSALVAGAWSSRIVNNGFWYSPSNTVLTDPTGPDVPIYMSATDQDSDTNNLNAAGIITVFNAFATGLRTWGNRSSAYPTYTDARTFLAVRMVLDVIEVSIQQASLQFVDLPITSGLINSVLGSVNAYLRDVIRQGGLLPGSKISFNSGDNPATQLAAGIIVFAINLMPPPPAEDITYNFTVDTSLLNSLTSSQSST